MADMNPKDALIIVSDIINEFESFVEGFDPEHWSDPEEYPEDCDETTGRFGTDVLNEVGRALEVLKACVDDESVQDLYDQDESVEPWVEAETAPYGPGIA